MKKKKFLLFGALIPLVFSSCSNTTDNANKNNQAEQAQTISIANKETLSKTWNIQSGARFVEITTNESLLIENAIIDKTITISSSDESVVKVYGQYLQPVGLGGVRITVKMGEVTDYIDISITKSESLAPLLIVQGDLMGDYNGGINSAISIPKVACYDYMNNDISSSVTVTSDKDPNATYDFKTGTFKSGVSGRHTITYKVVDPDNPELFSEKTISLFVGIGFTYNDGTFTVKTNNDGSQVVTSSNTSFGRSSLNVDASKVYYGETNIAITPTGNAYTAGMAHYIPSNNNRWLASVINAGDTNWNMKDFIAANGWNMDGGPFSWQLLNNRLTDGKDSWGNNRTTSVSTIKYAIARVDDKFYTFVNDHVVCVYTSNYYGGIDTIPGFFGHNFSDGNTIYSNINYYNDPVKVQQKIDELYANDTAYVQAYRPNTGWNCSEGTDLIVNPISETRGVNFDFINDAIGTDNQSIATPYIYFSDDFTFEWDYKFTSTSSTEGRMWLELSTATEHDHKSWFELGSKFFAAGGGQTMMDLEGAVNNGWATGSKYDHQFNFDNAMWGEGGLDTSKGLHYKVVSDLQNICRTFYLEISSIANPNQKLSRKITTVSGNWNKEIKVLWKNRNCAGQYSNITWSTIAAPINDLNTSDDDLTWDDGADFEI